MSEKIQPEPEQVNYELIKENLDIFNAQKEKEWQVEQKRAEEEMERVRKNRSKVMS